MWRELRGVWADILAPALCLTINLHEVGPKSAIYMSGICLVSVAWPRRCFLLFASVLHVWWSFEGTSWMMQTFPLQHTSVQTTPQNTAQHPSASSFSCPIHLTHTEAHTCSRRTPELKLIHSSLINFPLLLLLLTSDSLQHAESCASCLLWPLAHYLLPGSTLKREDIHICLRKDLKANRIIITADGKQKESDD